MDRYGNRDGVNGLGAGYDPYTYQPMMRAFFYGGRFPQEITRAQEENPEAARHIGAIFQFGQWFQGAMPEAYNAMMARNPAALDPLAIVANGTLVATRPASSSGNSLAGMGDIIYDTNGQPYDTGESVGYNSGDWQGSVTAWGKSLTDFAKNYLVYDSQKRLLDANIKRAEQGLPPLDASAYGLGLNVGLTPATQKLVLYGLIGLAGLAIFSGMSRRRA